MSKQLEAKPVQVSSPAGLLRILNKEYIFNNDDVVVAVLKNESIFGASELYSVHYSSHLDSELNTITFYEEIADMLRDDEGTFAIVPVRGRDHNHVDAGEVENIFSDYYVLDVIQADWTEKTWASDMCSDDNCCDQSMTQSFLEEQI